jgi:hypothetical protein
VLWNRNDQLRFPVLVPFPVPTVGTLEKFWFRIRFRFQFRIRTYLATFFKSKKFVQNLAFSMLEAALFPGSWPLIFDFLTSVLHFMLDPGPNPVQEPDPKPEFIRVPDPLRQNVAVPQH